MTVIAFTGYAQSGKDSAAGFLVDIGFTKLAFADPLRAAVYALNPILESTTRDVNDQCCAEIVLVHTRVQDAVNALGYEVAKKKYPEYRALLQRFGTEVGRAQFGENFWVERVTSQIKSDGNYVISDARFPNEVQAVHNLGGKVLRIIRPGTGAVNTHVSDTGIDSLIIDGAISNTGDLDRFRDLVLMAVNVA